MDDHRETEWEKIMRGNSLILRMPPLDQPSTTSLKYLIAIQFCFLPPIIHYPNNIYKRPPPNCREWNEFRLYRARRRLEIIHTKACCFFGSKKNNFSHFSFRSLHVFIAHSLIHSSTLFSTGSSNVITYSDKYINILCWFAVCSLLKRKSHIH